MASFQDPLTPSELENYNSDTVVTGIPTEHWGSTDPTNSGVGDAVREALVKEDPKPDFSDTREEPRSLLSRLFPPGGLLSSVFNITSCCVGAGIVGLPAATNSSGLVVSILYLIAMALFSVYSLYLISVMIERTGCITFEDMAGALLGRGINYLACAVRILNTFGGCVACLICIGNIFTAILNNVDSAPEYLKTTSGNRLLISMVWLCILLPLVIPRHINTLRYVSAAGVFFIIYFVFMMIVHSIRNGLPENVEHIHLTGSIDDEGIHLFGTGNPALNSLGVFMFCYLCQVNAFEVYWDMRKRTAQRFTLYSAISMCIIWFLYIGTACFGYLDFRSLASDSVLLLYDPLKNVGVMLAYIGVVVKLCSSYTLLAMGTRNSIYYILKWDADKVVFWKHCIIVLLISLLMLICGLFIPKINTVFGFVGGICGGFLAFIFPALFIMYGGNWSLKSVGWLQYLATYALLISGVVAIVFSTTSTVYSVIVVS